MFKILLVKDGPPAVLNSEVELNFIRKAQNLLSCASTFCMSAYWIGGTSEVNYGGISYIDYSDYRTTDAGTIL